MAGSVNKVILVGNVGRDPEIRTMQNGGRVASFSLATSETWKDRATGERREKTEWHRIAIYNDNLVSVVERYVKKGTKLYIEGQLETRKWTDQSGQERYTTEVVIKQFRGELTLLDGRGAEGGGFGAEERAGHAGGGYGGRDYGPPSEPPGPAPGRGRMDDLDDEIPF